MHLSLTILSFFLFFFTYHMNLVLARGVTWIWSDLIRKVTWINWIKYYFTLSALLTVDLIKSAAQTSSLFNIIQINFPLVDPGPYFTSLFSSSFALSLSCSCRPHHSAISCSPLPHLWHPAASFFYEHTRTATGWSRKIKTHGERKVEKVTNQIKSSKSRQIKGQEM